MPPRGRDQRTKGASNRGSWNRGRATTPQTASEQVTSSRPLQSDGLKRRDARDFELIASVSRSSGLEKDGDA